MVNLIPPGAKKSVIVEYWLRVLTVWSLLATAIAVLFAVTLLPVYVSVDTQIDVYQKSAEEALEKIAILQSVSKDLSRSTKQAQLLIASTKETSLSQVIELFDSLEINGIVLSQMDVKKMPEGGLAPVNLSGNARDRQALADFRDRLLAQDSIETVDFPISNLAKDRDIDFAITVTMNNQLSL